MKKLPKFLTLMTIVSSLALSACGGSSSSTGSTANKDQASNDAKPDATGAKTLRLAYIMAPGGPADEGAKKFKEIVEEKTKGTLKVSLAPNSQLGAERDVMEGLKMGTVEMSLTGDAPIGMFAPKYAALQMAYVFRDMDHVHKVYDGPIGKDLEKELLKVEGARVLDYWDRGPRMLTAKKEIKTPDDLKGIKVRVPEVQMQTEAWKAIGANPTPIALGELYNALQQGMVDAEENTLELIDTGHYDEVQKYVMRTDHLYSPYFLFISDKVLSSLTPEQQKIVQDTAKEAGNVEKKLTADSEKTFEENLKKRGMKFVDVDRNLFVDKVKQVIPKLQSNWKEGLYDQIVNTK
jgi:tripartite ATP-independent transporter DctP family solute receptor